ncbi:hypothetical protein G6F61_015076 [Rhizopus arrhizus]|nr:hypothetical protein G6F61_015076 [Rhizopus arrhizus]
MKMIASTKVTKAQRGMEAARAFGASSNALFTNAETKAADDAKMSPRPRVVLLPNLPNLPWSFLVISPRHN